jgi:hypothetical protein
MGTALGFFGDVEEDDEEDEDDEAAAVELSFFSASFSFRLRFFASFSFRWLLRKTWKM